MMERQKQPTLLRHLSGHSCDEPVRMHNSIAFKLVRTGLLRKLLCSVLVKRWGWLYLVERRPRSMVLTEAP
ncbi:hypothetical protein BIW11_03202 [Tropilaelaps mercedesae]|uniref:Uncharacterized protein n=1 Tax=Tropilaelaps mercedesae TaxID=418985 RepID=A0A1V9XQN9_9ACAR|nr:hypothetical protein BIW11_03202 [Tropilaelaps mercedesae]